MIAYIIRRILYALPIALGVAVIIFSLVHIAPGDPLSALVPADAPSSVVERLRQDYGMDRPLPAQFALWLGRVLQGDLGISIATRRPVPGELYVDRTSSVWGKSGSVRVDLGGVQIIK